MANGTSKSLLATSLILAIVGVGMGGYGMYVIQTEGIQGPEGPEGPQGITGEDGIDGTDGLDGINGTDGTDGINGTDGVDAPGYYCSDYNEIMFALAGIGNGTGRIVISSDIILYSSILINRGGTYIIQGESPGITLECSMSNTAFYVLDAESCVIEDLTINATGVTSVSDAVMWITTSNVRIENLKIFGDADQLGYGIYCTADNLRVQNCKISQMQRGIYIDGGINSYIDGNTVEDCGVWGILSTANTEGGIVQNNDVSGCDFGIDIYGFDYIIKNNHIMDCWYAGIYIHSNNTIVSENLVIGITGDYGANQVYGIAVYYLAGDNLLTGNSVSGIHNTGTANGFGMAIGGHYNLIVGNKMFDNDDNMNSPPADNEIYGNMLS